MSGARRLAAGIALLVVAAAAGAQAVTPADFAWSAPVVPEASGPLQELRLPEVVYREATHAGLGDLRVFNAAGDPVPHGLLPAPLAQTDPPPRRQPLPAFPFAELPARTDAPPAIEVEQADGRTRIVVRGGGHTAPGAWVVDARTLESRPRALLLSWPPGSAPLTRRVQLLGSHDLSRWRRLGEPATLADVRRAGEHLLANRVETPRTSHRWYRLEPVDGGGPLPPLTVEAELATDRDTAVRRDWMTVGVQALDEPAGAVAFATPVALPVERLRVLPTERNSFVRLRVEARDDSDGEWRTVGHGSAWQLDFDNGSLQSPPITVRAPATSTDWRLVPSDPDAASAGTGFGREPPRVDIGWTPRSLVFLARGKGPFRLAFGSRRAEPVTRDGRTLLGETLDIVGLPQARAGAAERLPGAERALTAPSDVDWKRLLLWGVLVLGAALLGALALGLLRHREAG